MNRADMKHWMERTFQECQKLRDAGQQEYAHAEENAFANFERVSNRVGVSRELVLLVYLEKHMDGIAAYCKGHKSQRENVRGRIGDAIVYLCMLRGMIEETEEREAGLRQDIQAQQTATVYLNKTPGS